ncbi:hypothetical protein Pcinc_031771 [Petrolisthes cinctipes]|uniref:Uncharacterized protein n=1 Tax=Petrolisthes cinctipes TaxID=88211 RepID=A0AAE1K256_PETCI|nr:hypothetical protein Pcinc_031771 [Petrolisthes cinctipes]
MHNKGSVSVLNSSRVTRAPFIPTTPRLLTLATGSHALLSSPDPHASLPSPLATLPSFPPLTPTPPYPRHWPSRLTFLTETPRLLTFATGPHALLWITRYGNEMDMNNGVPNDNDNNKVCTTTIQAV